MLRFPFIVGPVLALVGACHAQEPLTKVDRATIHDLVDRAVDNGEIVASPDESACIERRFSAEIGGTEEWNAIRTAGNPTQVVSTLYDVAGSCLSAASARATVAASLVDTPPERATCVGSALIGELGKETAVSALGSRRLNGPFDQSSKRALLVCESAG